VDGPRVCGGAVPAGACVVPCRRSRRRDAVDAHHPQVQRLSPLNSARSRPRRPADRVPVSRRFIYLFIYLLRRCSATCYEK